MMKKLILTLITIPFFGFGQSKTEKVATQVGAAAVVTAGVIGLFKKKKDKSNTTETQNPTKSKTSANPDGTYPVNTKPEEILFNIYKCPNYKDFEVEVATNEKTGEIIYQKQKHCVWKPELADFGSFDEERAKYLREYAPTLATKVDTVMSFKQNGINNTILATGSYFISENNDIESSHVASVLTGIIRLQSTDGKSMKLVSNQKIMTESGAWGKPGRISILQIDDENIFYKMESSDMHQGVVNSLTDIYSLDGNLLIGYEDYDSSAMNDENYDTHETKMEIDQVGKIVKLISSNKTYKKGKVIKNSKSIKTYQYGNGTITEMKISTPKKAK